MKRVIQLTKEFGRWLSLLQHHRSQTSDQHKNANTLLGSVFKKPARTVGMPTSCSGKMCTRLQHHRVVNMQQARPHLRLRNAVRQPLGTSVRRTATATHRVTLVRLRARSYTTEAHKSGILPSAAPPVSGIPNGATAVRQTLTVTKNTVEAYKSA